ncbi:YjaG family protein [Gayadomonas joobiniege]|uniref:YjaG family protein n=1 Tax=Gayadomonas joobiniege TaxID=1234606 RepID=UPI0003715F90|nr:YjaG family protein [Gayadomonas joobiniege]
MTKKPSTFARIRALSAAKQIAFNLMLIERMLPNYQLYQEISGEGDVSVLQKLNDLLWQSLYNKQLKINLEVQQEKLEAAIPQTAESESIGLYAAIDAAVALLTTLNLLDKNNEYKHKEVTLPAVLSQATIERMLIMNAEVEHSQEALTHPHMQWEIDTQNEFLDSLEALKNINKESCATLKAQALAEGVSNLGVSLD